MPTKKKTTYLHSRTKLQKRLDKLADKLQDFDLYSSTYGEIEGLINDLEAEFNDLSFDAIEKKY